MNFKLRLLALLLLVMMVFTSCSLESVLQYIPGLGTTTKATVKAPIRTTTTTTTTTGNTTPSTPKWNKADHSTTKNELIERYTLTQEEVDAILDLLDQMVAGAMPDPNGDPNVAAMTIEEWDALYQQFDASFYHIAEQMTIATIIYYCNMVDEVAIERKSNATDMVYSVQDKYNESLRYLYLNSPMKDELFEGWSKEEIQSMLEYDPAIMEVKKTIEDLETQFDALDYEEYGFTNQSVELYKQLIINRRKIAEFNKYDNYYTYASKNIYERDYSAENLEVFREYVIKYIVPSYEGINAKFNEWRNLSEKRQETFVDFVNGGFDKSSKNYLLLYLDSLEGTMGENMRHMFDNKNCVFSINKNSHPTAFCTYLYVSEQPFCLFGNDGQDASTIVHEVGHYYAFATNKDLDNYDLCETHSQGNEFLFIKFCEGEMNSAIYDCVRAYNLLATTQTMILATIVDEFEQRVYALDDETIMSMTSEDFDAIMTEVCEPYGGAKWVTDNLYDPYIYWRRVAISSPVYYISYAVSAAAAIEIFAIAESEVEGEGYEAAKTIYAALAEEVLPEDGFLNALKKAGLYTPFEEDAFRLISATLNK